MLLYEKYMLRCLELASKGLGKTRANPLVGAVIVHDDLIIGEGYHYKFGGTHAEVNAINSVKNKQLLKYSTLFVNLEPCTHFGKTPPCSLLIKDAGIPRVVIGCTDPNPVVSGKGVRFLGENGTELITGILEKECRFLNRRFYTYHEQKRPYIILKWAETKDKYIDNREPGDFNNPPLRITGDLSRILVHKWRSEEMAILAGTNTINMDNPSLNVRYWSGENPIRISFERNTKLRDNSRILMDEFETLIYSSRISEVPDNSKYVVLEKIQDFRKPFYLIFGKEIS
jgi:diaminohydroxyphosphoribosylaminopyrimidine deaminase / 5-amino-6-(5-phosphoribosylamino)uracil reductase